MLVLGRKPGEYVMIGDSIKIKVVRSDEGDLRLAIEAPKNFNILRGEVYEKSGIDDHWQQRIPKGPANLFQSDV